MQITIQDAHSRPVGIAPRRLYGVYRIKDSSPADYRTPRENISVLQRKQGNSLYLTETNNKFSSVDLSYFMSPP